MTLASYLVPFILAAIATGTILVVGVLGAADLLHRPRTARPEEPAPARLREVPAEAATDHDDPHPGRAA